MDFRSFLAGILVAYGLVNLLAVFGIGIHIAMPLMVSGFDVGNVLLSLLALAIAYFLVRN